MLIWMRSRCNMKYLEIVGLSILAIFAPIKAILIAALVLVMADFITGVIAAYKRKEPITSSGFKQSILKAVIYEIAIILAYLAEHFLIGDLVPATKIVGTLIGLTELKSCLENLDSISGSSFFQTLIDKLVSSNDKTP